MGISWEDFWRMSPRAVFLMQKEWIRRHEGGKDGEKGQKKGRRLERIPRP